MPAFRSQPLADLARQLSYVPAKRRREQIDRAEALFWEIDPEHVYPLAQIVYRITAFRLEAEEESVDLVGEALREDLLLLVDRLSSTLNERMSDYDPPPLSVEQASKQLGVSERTLQRYRPQGLFIRRLLDEQGKRRVAILPHSLERFIEARGRSLHKASSYSRLSADTKRRIVARARELTSQSNLSVFVTARRLAGQFDRSIETVRHLLIEHDNQNPEQAIFTDHRPPLTVRLRQVIYRAYHFGTAVSKIARHFGKGRDAIYRAVHQRRLRLLKRLDLQWVTSPTFEREEADEVILGGDLAAQLTQLLQSPPDHDRPTEQLVIVRYNYLKYRAARMLGQINRYRPSALQIDEVETDLRTAGVIKQLLLAWIEPSVSAVLRRHGNIEPTSDRQHEGPAWQVIRQAIDRYDSAGTSSLSTYVNWALMRHLAHVSSQNQGLATPHRRDRADQPDRQSIEQQLLLQLDPTTRRLICGHLGIPGPQERFALPVTLQQVAEQLEMTLEQASQTEHRTLIDLRRQAWSHGVKLHWADVPQLD